MFNLEGLKRWYWYYKRVQYLKDYEAHAHTNLEYFAHVRRTNMMRQKIGLQDMNATRLPRVNPKKEQITMGPSEGVMNRILDDLPYQYEILRRWQRRTKVRNKTITGKVIFQ